MMSEQETVQTLDAKHLEEVLIDINLVFRKHRDLIKEKYKISALEMELIQFVVTHGKQRMKDVAQYFNIKLSTLTSTIDKAEKARILKRINSTEDRRVVYLDTTKKGRDLFEQYDQELRGIATRIQQDMDEATFKLFVEGMEVFNKVTMD
ncbi:MAG: MarR family transcriptional regulator [Bacteroidota bacterium]